CEPLEPFVADLRTDPEPAAQLPPVHTFLQRKLHKFTTLLHDRHLAPRHGRPPSQPNPRNDDVSAMSPNTRQSCVRAEQVAKQSRSKRKAWIASSPRPRNDGVYFKTEGAARAAPFLLIDRRELGCQKPIPPMPPPCPPGIGGAGSLG